jgi:hypothetical protein
VQQAHIDDHAAAAHDAEFNKAEEWRCHYWKPRIQRKKSFINKSGPA